MHFRFLNKIIVIFKTSSCLCNDGSGNLFIDVIMQQGAIAAWFSGGAGVAEESAESKLGAAGEPSTATGRAKESNVTEISKHGSDLNA